MSNKSPVPPVEAPGLSAGATLKESLGGLAHALGGRAVDTVARKTGGVTQRLSSYAAGAPSPAGATRGTGRLVDKASSLKETLATAATGINGVFTGIKETASGVKESAADVTDKVKDVLGGVAGRSGNGFKFNNIIETIDVGAPVDVVYDAWTEYGRWPDFMKKVESVELNPDDGTVSLKGKVLWSHRQWDTTIVDQVPGKRIVWDSTGRKGHLSGAVTFHPLGEDLTRMVLAIDYYPSGLVEKTANIWRALNRRLRLELKLFVRYVMNDAALHPDDLEGYRAEIQDEDVVRTHDEVLEEQSQDEGEEPEDEYEEYEDEEYEEEPEGEDEPPKASSRTR